MALTQNIKQLRYYSDGSVKNYPSNLTASQLISGECFTQYLPAVELGVAALPGTMFYINGGSNSVIVNFSGLFNLKFTDTGLVSTLKFDSKTIHYIESNDSAYLIVDLIYYTDNDSVTSG